MVAKILSSSYIGIELYILEVEVDIMPGLSSLTIVGLADVAISESKERVRATIKIASLSNIITTGNYFFLFYLQTFLDSPIKKAG